MDPLAILRRILVFVSEDIREAINAMINELREKASETENDVDDLIVDIIAWLLRVPTEETEETEE